MKRKDEMVLLLFFCIGIIGGVLLPKWMFPASAVQLSVSGLDSSSIQQYLSQRADHQMLLRKIAVSRGSLLLILYFSGYSAAGFWILAGTLFLVGASMGFLAVLSVLQMQIWGVLFWCCALFPQWIFYGLAGQQIADFIEKRRVRTELCKGNAAASWNRRIVLDFLQLLLITGVGIGTEVFINQELLRSFLKFYLSR